MTRALGVDPQGFKASSIFKLDREQSHLQGIEPSKQTWWNFSLSVELLKPLFKCFIGFKSLKPVLNCLEGNIVDRIRIPQVDSPFFPHPIMTSLQFGRHVDIHVQRLRNNDLPTCKVQLQRKSCCAKLVITVERGKKLMLPYRFKQGFGEAKLGSMSSCSILLLLLLLVFSG